MAKVIDMKKARAKRAAKKAAAMKAAGAKGVTIHINQFIIVNPNDLPPAKLMKRLQDLGASLPFSKLMRQIEKLPVLGVYKHLTPEHEALMKSLQPILFAALTKPEEK